MKYAKRLVSLFLLLSITVGSTAALAVSTTSGHVSNSAPKITTIKFQDNAEGGAIRLCTNFALPSDQISTSNELPLIYRSTKQGKFKPLSESRKHLYTWESQSNNHSIFNFYDCSAQNGTFYRYRLATTRYNPSTKKSSLVVYSKEKSIYYLNPMYSSRIHIKNSANGKNMTISWNRCRNSKADGYQLCYWYYWDDDRNNAISDRIYRKVKGSRTTKITLKNRTPDKQYCLRMRSYKKYKGTVYYGNWSETILRY